MNSTYELQSLPDELVLHIAKFVAQLLHGSPAVKSKALKSFCLVNKQFCHCGQEVLFQDCDVAYRPLKQPFQLLQTLLAKPALGYKVKSIKLSVLEDDIFSGGCSAKDGILVHSLLPEVKSKLWQLPMREKTKLELFNRMSTDTPLHWYCILLALTPNLSCLDLRNLAFIEHEDFLWDLAVDYPHLILGNLENLKIQTREDAVQMLRCSPRFLRLGRLRTLELTYPPMDQTQGQTDWVQTKLINLMTHYANHFELESLILNGWCSPESLRTFLSSFKGLRCLTYRPFRNITHANANETMGIWDALNPLGDTLECLILQFPGLEDNFSAPIYEIWPCMGVFTKLTKFELVGAVELVPSLMRHPNAHRLWPPNLQHFTFAVVAEDIGFSLSISHQSIWAISKYIEIQKAMPRLKSITLTPETITHVGRDQLEDWLIPDGAKLYAWSFEEQAAFPKLIQDSDGVHLRHEDDNI